MAGPELAYFSTGNGEALGGGAAFRGTNAVFGYSGSPSSLSGVGNKEGTAHAVLLSQDCK